MARRKSNTVARERVSDIPATTIKLGWGDTRLKTNTQGGGFYVYYGDRFMYQSFDTVVTAKHFIEAMINGDDYRWEVWPDYKIGPVNGIVKEPMLVTASGVQIRGAGLETAIEYEFQNDTEREFVFPEPYARQYAVWVARGPNSTEPRQEPKPEAVYDPDTHTLVRPAKTPKAPRAPKPDKPKAPSKEGLVLVSTIAADNKWDAKHVRAALRKAGVTKPDVGWAFPPSEVAAITKLIKENIKQ